MQRLSGMLLLLAGAALGAYTYLPAPQDGEQRLAEVTRISAAPDRDMRKPANPDRAAAAQTMNSIITSNAHAAEAAQTAVPAVAPVTTGALAVAQQTGGWSAVVTTETQTNGRLTSAKPGDGETRMQLARDLQRELKRVGCYGGEITGNWTPSSQRAMSAFMDRVNASLPADEPDYILLTLVQGHTATACGSDCPSGQVAAEGGRCVPHAVVAQASRKSEREQNLKLAAERKAASELRVAEERKAAAERKIADAREAEAKTSAIRKAETQKAAEQRVTVAAAAPAREELPWLNGAQQTEAQAGRPTPLPGMMSVGGPRFAAAEAPDSAGTANRVQPVPVSPVIAIPPEAMPQYEPSTPSSAAPVVTQPEPQHSVKAPAKPVSQQGLPGGKSGVTVRRSAERPAAAPSHPPPRPHPTPSFRRSPPAAASRPAPKPKYNYYASNSGGGSQRHERRYYTPRSGSGHYNMMQAYSGIY